MSDERLDESPPEDEFDVVEWLSEHPADWEHATADDYLAAHPQSRSLLDAVTQRAAVIRRRRPRRVGWIALGAATVAVGGGALVVAVFDGSQPSRPEAGTVCRREARIGSDAVVVGGIDDPIRACGEVWTNSKDFGPPQDDPPPLSACIGPNGAIEVFPGPGGVCEELGLDVAAANPDRETATVVSLQERIIEEINSGPCQSADEVVQSAERILEAGGFDNWSIQVNPDAEGSKCAIVAVDSQTRTLTIASLD